ncbi:hypothetical protein [Runella zeae]|uniref:hypothetical protein n=1 Tax=Runella zeae TaxID=94255 RepID=UPI0012F96C0B|nr:hypothetical protein [Runella zeae]
MQNFSKLPPDRDNATYHHIAYYLNGRQEHGWSKKVNMNETGDKRRLLCSSLSRLLPLYFQKEVWQVEVYRRVKPQTGSRAFYNEEMVGRFWGADWELYGAYQKDTIINHFLKEFYASGNGPAALQAIKKGVGAVHDFSFDPQGKTLEDLKEKCRSLLEFYPRGQVEKFFFEVKKRYFPQPVFSTAIDPPSPPPPAPAPKRKRIDPKPVADLIPKHLKPDGTNI